MARGWKKAKTFEEFKQSVLGRILFCNPVTGCWEWTGTCNFDDYGTVGWRHRTFLVHRLICEWLVKIPTLKLLHKCDNPKCCNPAHEYEGTDVDNVRDRVLRGRNFTKLTKEQVMEIRQKYSLGNTTQSILAVDYGVNQSTVSEIINNVNWRSI